MDANVSIARVKVVIVETGSGKIRAWPAFRSCGWLYIYIYPL